MGVYSRSGGKLYAHITGESGEWIEPLDTDRLIEVPGPLGNSFVRIEGGKVGFIDSPCDNKLCIDMGFISEQNMWVACLPNRVFVKIDGGGANEDLDASAY